MPNKRSDDALRHQLGVACDQKREVTITLRGYVTKVSNTGTVVHLWTGEDTIEVPVGKVWDVGKPEGEPVPRPPSKAEKQQEGQAAFEFPDEQLGLKL
jgi:hypothetical protein